LKKFKKEQQNYGNITQKVTIQRTFITIKFTYFEIQTITWRHDMIEVCKITHDMYDRSVALE